MSEQRWIYDAYWQRYHAVRQEVVTVETIMITALGGKCRAVLYRPAQHAAGENLPIVVYFYCGGWMFGSKESHGLPVSRLYAEAEVAGLSLHYVVDGTHLSRCADGLFGLCHLGYLAGLTSLFSMNRRPLLMSRHRLKCWHRSERSSKNFILRLSASPTIWPWSHRWRIPSLCYDTVNL